MKKLIFSICVLSFMLTGFNQEERFVEQSNTEIFGRISAVGQKPKIEQQLMNLELNEGGIAVFLARFAPIDDPNLKAEWYHNEKTLPISDDRIKSYLEEGYATLVINKVKPADAGIYRVKICNALVEDVSEAKLTVTK